MVSVFDKAIDGKFNFETMRQNSFSVASGDRSRLPADENQEQGLKKIIGLMGKCTPSDPETIHNNLVRHIEYSLTRNRWNCDEESMYRATALSVRDRLLENFNDTNAGFFRKDPKRVYYFSLEFLIGRAMQNAMVNLDIEKDFKMALNDVGYDLEALYDYEKDAALGNGGLGRLAACYMDSCATTCIPAWGYGIRYTYGIFEQKIVNGRQIEYPDFWLSHNNPWEICRADVSYAVRFGGTVESYRDEHGNDRKKWINGTIVQAEAYDNPIPGFDTANCISLRLWRARPCLEFDFHQFNEGNYLHAVEERQAAESITAVLYPNDSSEKGKELRLTQQYFFVCASIQDIIRRFKKVQGRDWEDLPNKMAIQLNDTHPAISIPELMRILIDIEGLEYQRAWNITKEAFRYTNHTVLQEALEKWPVHLFEKLLPRHLLLINDINYHFISSASKIFPNNWDKINRLSIYQEGDCKMLRMANLAVIGSSKVNGVAEIHSHLVKRDIFPDFVDYYNATGEPDKFVNVTNGVTIRRWLHNCNRPLSDLISKSLGSDQWLKSYSLCEGILHHVNDEEFRQKWKDIKYNNKLALVKWVKKNCGLDVCPKMMFDVQVKRIHEYKRQLMFNFWVIHRYLKLKQMSKDEISKIQPRCCMIGGKAAPGYYNAKTIIAMTNAIGKIVNNDPDTCEYLKLIFLPNYNISSAAIIIPGTDLSEQISTAGLEASGTGNMKFVMNGGIIIGTMDGANVEIREEIGDENIFIFGALEEETRQIRENAKNGNYPLSREMRDVFDAVKSGRFSNGDGALNDDLCRLVDSLLNNGNGVNGDHYLLIHDFKSYCDKQDEVDGYYQDYENWITMSIHCTALMGKFSSDRSIADYAATVWGCEPLDISTIADKYALPTPRDKKVKKVIDNKAETMKIPTQTKVNEQPTVIKQ